MEDMIRHVVQSLRAVAGIDAVVLGGSHATGHATAQSDIDIGVYYGAHQTLDVVALNRAVQQLDDDHREHLVDAPGGWGPWVNAGAWMRIQGHSIDIILRETMRVKQVIAACMQGDITSHYQPGHPHAFINVMYMGELHACKVLWDATNVITPLKMGVDIYPDAVQQGIYRAFRFEAQFSIDLAGKSINRQDAYYVTAHLVRAISALNQVIFALNRQYCLNEKQAVPRAGACEKTPYQYQQRVEAALEAVWHDPQRACASLQEVINDVERLLTGE